LFAHYYLNELEDAEVGILVDDGVYHWFSRVIMNELYDLCTKRFIILSRHMIVFQSRTSLLYGPELWFFVLIVFVFTHNAS